MVFFRRHYVLLFLVMVAAALLFYAFGVEPNQLVVKRYELTLPKLSPAHDRLRIAILSDLHIQPSWTRNGRLDRIAMETQRERPDLILLVGDYINGMGGEKGNITMPELTGFLKKFHAPQGIFAVQGNHEFWFGLQKVAGAVEAAGVRMLDNDAAILNFRHARLVIAGTQELSTASPDLVRTLRYARRDDPVILLSHNPTILPIVPSWVSLTVCGHTHGGQLRLPFLGNLLMPRSLRSKYQPGISEENGRKLLLTSGIGGSPIQARICCPPEIVILTLRSGVSPETGKNDTVLRRNDTPETKK